MSAELPQAKQTALELYITAKEAYEKWQADSDNVIILDVRTPEEYLFVGHPTMAWKIPIIVQSYEWDDKEGKYPMQLLPDFVARVSEQAASGWKNSGCPWTKKLSPERMVLPPVS